MTKKQRYLSILATTPQHHRAYTGRCTVNGTGAHSLLVKESFHRPFVVVENMAPPGIPGARKGVKRAPGQGGKKGRMGKQFKQNKVGRASSTLMRR